MNKLIKLLIICAGSCGLSKAAETVDLPQNVGRIIYPTHIQEPMGEDTARIIGVKALEQRNGEFSDVYFIGEKLTEKNIKMWRSFVADQSKRRAWNDNAAGARNGFLRVLDLYRKVGQAKIFVFYAASKNPNEEPLSFCPKFHPVDPQKSYIKSDVEIIVGAVMDQYVLTLYGLFRNIESVNSEEAHKNAAIELQGFGATASKLMCRERDIMVTTPLDVMRNIMLRNLNDKPNQIWVGDETDRLKQRKKFEGVNQAILDLADLESNLENEKDLGCFDFTFFENSNLGPCLTEKTICIELNEYLREKSISEILLALEAKSSILWDKSLMMLVSIVNQLGSTIQTMSEQDAKINILYLLKKACIHKMRGHFVATRTSIMQDKIFTPNFQEPSILDNTKANYVLRLWDKEISFPEPSWFAPLLHGSSKLTVVVRLKALKSKW